MSKRETSTLNPNRKNAYLSVGGGQEQVSSERLESLQKQVCFQIWKNAVWFTCTPLPVVVSISHLPWCWGRNTNVRVAITDRKGKSSTGRRFLLPDKMSKTKKQTDHKGNRNC